MQQQKIRNMEEFASVSGISRPTISKYFNDPDSVRDSTRARIEAALERYDYRPNVYAINQNRRLTKNIGVVVPYLADPFFGEIARHIEGLIVGAGYQPILLSSNGEPAQEVENLESLRALKPAGLLFAPLGRASDRAPIEDFCNDVPTVLFDCNINGLGSAFIGHDNAKATRAMCEHLCRTGEPPCFFEMSVPPNPNAYRRRESYRDVMESLGHEPQLIQVDGSGWNFEEIGYREGRRVLEAGRLPSRTVLCSNDRLAIGFLAAAYESGLRVGRGSGFALRVAGHDDHPFSRYTCPSLTTISQNYTAISEKSLEVLLEILETDSHPSEREVALFDGRLIARASA